MGFDDVPILSAYDSGVRLVELARRYDFAFFPHWITDVVGHRGTRDEAVNLLEQFDAVMAGVLDCWQDDEGFVIVTSDHGNMEAIGNRKHTENDVPTLVIGDGSAAFADGIRTLADITPRVLRWLGIG
jgi:bisphosphoglycerate-independent phosphoglycerate mutase (AlkP superfamily)